MGRNINVLPDLLAGAGKSLEELRALQRAYPDAPQQLRSRWVDDAAALEREIAEIRAETRAGPPEVIDDEDEQEYEYVPRDYWELAYGALVGRVAGEEEIEVPILGPERFRGTYIIGKNGTGKSTLIENMVLQDAERDCAVVVLDPHGELVEGILGRMTGDMLRKTAVLDFGEPSLSPGLNLYSDYTDPFDPYTIARLANRSVDVFKKIWGNDGWGPRMEDLLRMIGHTLVPNFGCLADVPALLTKDWYREGLLEVIRDELVLDYWRYEYSDSIIGPVMNKVRSFLADPLLRHSIGKRWSWDWDTWINEPRITLIKLPVGRLKEHGVSLLGSAIVGTILDKALMREGIKKEQRVPLFLYADEFQRFATEDFGTLLQEARKYRVGTVLAHQMRSQLNQSSRSAVLGAANMIAFQVTGEDAPEVARELPLSKDLGEERRQDLVDWLGHLPQYYARVHIPFAGTSEIIKTVPPRPVLKDGHAARLLADMRATLGEIDAAMAREIESNTDLPVNRKAPPVEYRERPKKPTRAVRPTQDPQLGAGSPVASAKHTVRREKL